MWADVHCSIPLPKSILHAYIWRQLWSMRCDGMGEESSMRKQFACIRMCCPPGGQQAAAHSLHAAHSSTHSASSECIGQQSWTERAHPCNTMSARVLQQPCAGFTSVLAWLQCNHPRAQTSWQRVLVFLFFYNDLTVSMRAAGATDSLTQHGCRMKLSLVRSAHSTARLSTHTGLSAGQVP